MTTVRIYVTYKPSVFDPQENDYQLDSRPRPPRREERHRRQVL